MTTATNMMSKKNYLSRPLILKYPNLSLNMIKAERDIFENDVVTAAFECQRVTKLFQILQKLRKF